MTAPIELKHPLEHMDRAKLGRSLAIFRPHEDTIIALCGLAKRSLPHSASADTVRRVVRHNPDAVWAIARRVPANGALLEAEGFIATLPLSELGLDQLVSDTFNGSDPDLAAIARPNEVPAAVYIWAAFAPGQLIGAVPLVFEKLSTPIYRGADLIARATTVEGERLSRALGLKRGALINGKRCPHLYLFERSRPAETNAPTYDSYTPGVDDRALSVTVAHTHDDVVRAMCIRAAVYMAEQDCPYDEEFDGNDFAATHLIGYAGREPAGCARIRYFGTFAKIERMAVRKPFRHTRLVFQLANAAIDLCQKKGYGTLYCHAQTRLVPLWKRFGFNPIESSQRLVFSDFEYVEMKATLDKQGDALGLEVDPYVLIRPEGRWHLPGILEGSVGRGVLAASSRG